MKYAMKDHKGFSLVELMIVVGIIGVLAAMAIPRLNVFLAKSKRAEASTNLSTISTMEHAYYAENSAYGLYPAIGYVAPAGLKYTYAPPTITATTFSATATAAAGLLCPGSPADNWSVNEVGTWVRGAATMTCN